MTAVPLPVQTPGLTLVRTPSAYAAVHALSSREREVLLLLADGLSNREVAARLYVSEATVKSHVARVLATLGVRDRVQAVIVAFHAGLVAVPGPRPTCPCCA
jgi:DNA-binding NarL/FixJ family response regulator